MRGTLRFIFIAVVALVIAACSGTPKGIIKPGTMAALLADIHTAEAVAEANAGQFGNDSLKRVLLQSVYAHHRVTSAQVDTSLYWYGNNLEKYMEVYDKTIEILEGKIADAEKSGARVDKNIRTVSADGDSVNLYRGIPYMRASRQAPSEYAMFHITTDKNWDRGDRYTLNARVSNPRSPLQMVIVADYNDGSSEYVTRRRSVDGHHQLTLALDSAKVATTVYGYIHYRPADDEVTYIDSISLVRTRSRGDNAAVRKNLDIIRVRNR